MGDLVGEALQQRLYFVPARMFQQLLNSGCGLDTKVKLFADLCRINTLYMIARAGSGHLGSSFSSLELVSWIALHRLDPRVPNVSGDLYFSSKGHDVPGFYAALVGLGALPETALHTLRRLDGLPGHPDVATAGIAANTGSLGMGISKAKGMVLAHRAQGARRDVFVLTGDGELQEGQIWESLASAVAVGMGELTVVVDHNKLQSDTHVACTSDLGDLEAKFASFGWQVRRFNGHDPAAMGRALGGSRSDDRPLVAIADTIKGRGVSFMEHVGLTRGERYRFHSGAPDATQYQRALLELCDRVSPELECIGCGPLQLEPVVSVSRPKPSARQPLLPAYGAALAAQATRHPRLMVLDADLGFDLGLSEFRASHGERFLECGIAEMDMVSQAGGMALRGALPICHSFASFLTGRANEQIFNNASERTRVIYVGGLAGLLPAGPGHSHQSLRDIAALRGVPGLSLLQPCHPREVELALSYAIERAPGSTYLRLCSMPWALEFELPSDYALTPGEGVSVRSGHDAVLIAYGPVMLAQACATARLLSRRHGIELEVVNLPWLDQVDAQWLLDLIGARRHLFTVDDHQLDGGQGQMICASLLQHAARGLSVRCFGVSGLPACGAPEEVLRRHGLDALSLGGAIAAALSPHNQPGTPAPAYASL